MMIGAVAGLLLVIICVIALVRRRRAAARREHLLELSEEADAFIAEARRGLEPIRTHLILKDGEHAVLEEASTLMETRAYRVYGGGAIANAHRCDDAHISVSTMGVLETLADRRVEVVSELLRDVLYPFNWPEPNDLHDAVGIALRQKSLI
jgi:hypothetical protein